MSNQPEWECIGQLGDANPVDYGGYWVFRDKTGVYDAEAEYLDVPNEESGEYRAYRFTLEKCTFLDGVLSDNKFHPECCAWWATTPKRMKERPQDGKGLTDIANSHDVTEEELIEQFCSGDDIQRALAYRCVGDCHGFINLDSYPLVMNQYEAKRRYKAKKYQPVQVHQ